MTILGFMTGTFDLLHKSHLDLIKNTKLYCDKLIIGLTSDELAIKQKRKTILTYDHRKSLLESNKYIDCVVRHTGSTKQEDYKKYKFDILFTGTDYLNSEEYSSFSRDYPNIKVVYFERGESSTTEFIKNFTLRLLTEFKTIKTTCLSGEINNYNFGKNENLVTKFVRVGKLEMNNTSNSYKMRFPPPRNWKIKSFKQENVPLITGVNSMREIEINNQIKDLKFSLFITHSILRKTNNIKNEILPEDYESRMEFMNEERRFAEEIYMLIMEDGGMTLNDYSKLPEFSQTKMKIYKQIKDNIEILRSKGILHMDLHVNNILIDNNLNTYFIDYGWGMSSRFDMEPDEKEYFKECMYKNFDWYHFTESLVYDGIENHIIDI